MHRATIEKDAGGGWRYRVDNNNGRNIDTSESYTRRSSALRALQRNHPVAKVDIYDADGRPWKTVTFEAEE